MLGTLFDIRDWLQQDAAKPMAQRHARDRAIAKATLSPGQLELTTTGSTKDQWRAVEAWWGGILDEYPPVSVSGIANLQRLGKALLGLAGVLLGVAAAGAGLAYDGQHPINLISLLGLLVGIPTVFLLLSLLLIPGKVWGLGWLQDILASLNPGQWLSLWLNRRAEVQEFGWLHQRMGGQSLGKWLMLNLAQYFSIGFALGAVGTLLALVTFSDLAFGWSTTLKLSPDVLVPWVQASAMPWASWLPQAVPSEQLIVAAQYFRGDGQGVNSQSLGAWWPYVLMCLLVYGLLPRLVLLWTSRWQLDRHICSLVVSDELTQGLLQRMGTPWIERSVTAATADAPSDLESRSSRDLAALPQLESKLQPLALQGPLAFLLWNDALSSDQAEAWRVASALPFVDTAVRLGSTTSLADESTQLLSVMEQADNLLVTVKGWEPPLLEFHDFLHRAAALLPAHGRLVVCPVGIEGEGLSAQDQNVWRLSLQSINHPQILLAD